MKFNYVKIKNNHLENGTIKKRSEAKSRTNLCFGAGE